MKIFLATSLRNLNTAPVLGHLRAAGHEVYSCSERPFNWRGAVTGLNANPNVELLNEALAHETSTIAFGLNYAALERSDACVLLLPSGLSSHLEAGWAAGRRKLVAVLAPEVKTPELMYKFFDDDSGSPPLFATTLQLLDYLRTREPTYA